MANFITVSFVGKPMSINIDKIISFKSLKTGGSELTIDAPNPIFNINESMDAVTELIRVAQTSKLHQ